MLSHPSQSSYLTTCFVVRADRQSYSHQQRLVGADDQVELIKCTGRVEGDGAALCDRNLELLATNAFDRLQRWFSFPVGYEIEQSLFPLQYILAVL